MNEKIKQELEGLTKGISEAGNLRGARDLGFFLTGWGEALIKNNPREGEGRSAEEILRDIVEFLDEYADKIIDGSGMDVIEDFGAYEEAVEYFEDERIDKELELEDFRRGLEYHKITATSETTKEEFGALPVIKKVLYKCITGSLEEVGFLGCHAKGRATIRRSDGHVWYTGVSTLYLFPAEGN